MKRVAGALISRLLGFFEPAKRHDESRLLPELAWICLGFVKKSTGTSSGVMRCAVEVLTSLYIMTNRCCVKYMIVFIRELMASLTERLYHFSQSRPRDAARAPILGPM